eukprot:583424-Pelagomonas_calceolata.AAC.3
MSLNTTGALYCRTLLTSVNFPLCGHAGPNPSHLKSRARGQPFSDSVGEIGFLATSLQKQSQEDAAK